MTRPLAFFIDDEPAILHSMKRLFHDSPLEVEAFASPAAALEAAAGKRPDVVVSDYRMPGMNGVELLNRFKEGCPGAVRILLTGFIDIDAAVDAINKGSVYRFFKKPWDDDELLAGVIEGAAVAVISRATTALPSYLRGLIDAESPEAAEGMARTFLCSTSGLGVASVDFLSPEVPAPEEGDGVILYGSEGGRSLCARLDPGDEGRALFCAPKERAMLDSLARSALEALAIARRAAKAHAEILELSERDQLSGISNRRSLEHFLRAEFDRWKRTDRAFSVLLIDVDSFKQINDGCGHEMGDRVIEAMGRLLRESCRAIDCPGRYGGDEFLVILPETAKDQATIVAARIAAAAAEAGRSLGLPAGLSLSIGLADSSGLDPTAAKPDPARLVAMADAAMYQVKRSGKGAIGVA